MAKEIDKEDPRVNIYDWTYEEIPILELKRWVDKQIEMGMNNVSLDISWGYYNDIDCLTIEAKK